MIGRLVVSLQLTVFSSSPQSVIFFPREWRSRLRRILTDDEKTNDVSRRRQRNAWSFQSFRQEWGRTDQVRSIDEMRFCHIPHQLISLTMLHSHYSLQSIGSLSSDVFERRTSTGSGLFALLSRDFDQIFGQIVSIRIKTLSKTNTVASRLIKREKGSLPVDVRDTQQYKYSSVKTY